MMHLCIGNWRWASMTWRVPSSNSWFCCRWSCRNLIFSRACREVSGLRHAAAGFGMQNTAEFGKCAKKKGAFSSSGSFGQSSQLMISRLLQCGRSSPEAASALPSIQAIKHNKPRVVLCVPRRSSAG